MSGKRFNPVIIAKGEDLGNGFCVVPASWLPEKITRVAYKNGVVENDKCVISSEFANNPWRATAVYSLDFQTEYTEADL